MYNQLCLNEAKPDTSLDNILQILSGNAFALGLPKRSHVYRCYEPSVHLV